MELCIQTTCLLNIDLLTYISQAAENAQRQARGEPPLPDEDISKQFKPIAPLPRLDAMITSGQIYNYCKQISQFCSQSLGKLYVAKALQQEKK